MLLEFKFRNYLSYKDEVTLQLTSIDSYQEHIDTHTISKLDGQIKLLKSLAIYGSNGGGKSNLTRAVTLMKNLVHDSFRDSLSKEEDREEWNCFFALSTQSKGKPSSFEISFIIANTIYRYGFEIFDYTIVSEWLYKTDKRETYLFTRSNNEFKINERSFPEGNKFKEVNSNVLFLSLLAQYNGKESGKVYNFFKNLNVIDALDEKHIRHVTSRLLSQDEKFKKWLSISLRFLEINSVSLSSDDQELLTQHGIYDEHNILVGYEDFSVEHTESAGTKKLVYLLGAIYDTLKKGKIFFIDEFDSKLHPNLCLKLVRLFNEFNTNGAQFIITAHESALLDKDVFRRDQIWFVDRNQFGISELYPMSNFKATQGLRNVSDFRKKYLNSDFGAAESINFSEEFINLTKSI